MNDTIDDLIEEDKTLTFENNSYWQMDVANELKSSGYSFDMNILF